MQENGKISLRQFSILVTLFTVGDSLLVLPSGMASQVKEDAWISAIIGVGIGLLAVCLFTVVASLNPEMTLVEFNNKILGKMLGTVLSLLFVVYFLLGAAANIREIGDFMTTQIMPETPIQAIHIMFLCIVVMAVRLGLETFARAGEIFFPGFVLFFILFVLFLLPQVHIENIQPVFGEGFISILRGSIIPATFSPLELVVFFMIMPYVNQPKHILRSFTMGALIGGIALILLILLTDLVLGAEATASKMYPSYNLAKKINIGQFLERIEAILSLMWFVTIFFKIVLFTYGITLGLSQIFKLKEYKVLTMPCAVFIMVLSICIAPNIVYYTDAILWYWPFLDLTFDVLFPSLLLGVYILRKKVFKLR
ncbi:endospore germination permease [Paenibacillus sp.]|jgi:spore germination protein KB|uniref:GerAB/ArcD/ProY family transporter n=1 Tax=Paenibacillus sp. TaxID=58172 RepID=UPI00281B012A|nr:endospore germination permease [Paenibacillus sp.]MDR0267138.1 endospore germination permease [Paenibacillus sp.]